MKTTSLSIVIVNYKTPKYTIACLRSIYENPPRGDFEVIVVDNNSEDGSAEKISSEFPQVNLIKSKENLGFSRGNNLGFEQAKYDIYLLLNSDTEVHDNALANLQLFLDSNPNASVVGGKNLNSDGSLQYSIKYYPRLTNVLSVALYLHRFFNGPNWCEQERRDHLYNKARKAEWLSGSYLAVRKEWYIKCEGLDPGFFMYSEDTDLCYRINNSGGEVWYYPDSVITHHGGASSLGIHQLSTEMILSLDRYARLHFSKLNAKLYRQFLLLHLYIRLIVLNLKSLFIKEAKTKAMHNKKTIYSLLYNQLDL